MRLADALRVHNAKHGLYVKPESRNEYTVTVRVSREYEIPIKAPDEETAKAIVNGLVLAGLVSDCTIRRETMARRIRTASELERTRKRLFSRGMDDRILGFSRDFIERQLSSPYSEDVLTNEQATTLVNIINSMTNMEGSELDRVI